MRMLRARSSRILVVVVVLSLFAGAIAALRKGPSVKPTPLLSVTETSTRTATVNAPATRPAAENVTPPSTRPATQTTVAATTRPTTQPGIAGVTPTTRPAVAEIPPSLPPLAEAQARFDAGKLVDARRTLNNAITSARLSDSEIASARELIGRINQTLVFGRKIELDDPFVGSHVVLPGQVLEKIAREYSISWELVCRINGIPDPRKVKAGQTLKVLKGPVHAIVHKRTFQMDLYLGQPGGLDSMLITTLPVGLGADGSTPLGTWKVINKLKNPTYHSPRGEGIMAADDPANPLGEYWLGLEGLDGQAVGKASYGIHGTIEPDSIGKEASMGCIRLRSEDIALVYELLVADKSRVVIVE